MKTSVKNILCIILAVSFCFCLCSCGTDRVKGTVWENQWGSAEFTKDGVLTIKNGDSTETFYYTDEKGFKDNCYVVTYKTSDDMKKEENGVFIPYYIRGKELFFKGECYKPAK